MSPKQLLQKLSTSVLNQVALSGTSLVVGMWLIRHSTDTVYALYVLAQAAVLLLLTAQGAFVATPLMVLSPKKDAEDRLRMMGSVDRGMARVLRPLCIAAVIVAGLAWFWDVGHRPALEVIAAGAIAAFAVLRRELLRGVAMVHARPDLALYADLFYCAALVVGALLGPYTPNPAAVVLLVGGVGSWVGTRWLRHQLHILAGWPVPDDGSSYWREMRSMGGWASAGALSYWGFAQGTNFVLQGFVGLAAVAVYNQARLMLVPAQLLTFGIKGQMVPLCTRWLMDFGLRGMVKKLSYIIVAIASLILAYFVFLWLVRDWVVRELMRREIAELDTLLLMWLAISLVAMVRDLYQNVMLSREKTREMSLLGMASSLIAVGIIAFGATHSGLTGAMTGMLAGEGLGLLGVLYLLWRELQAEPNGAH